MELQFLIPRRLLAGVCALVTFFGLWGCEERIRIHTDASSPRLVIYGYITTDTLCHGIWITRSSDYFSTGKPQPVSGAVACIRSGEEIHSLSENASGPGYYRMETPAAGRVGETYTLEVSLDFDGDGETETYQAVSFLPPPARLDSIALVPSLLSEYFMETLIWGRLPDEEINYFSMHFYLNDTLLNDSLQGFSLSSDEFLNSKELRGLPAFYLNQRRKSEVLLAGDRITFQMESITREYSDFISQAQSESRGAMPLFGGPPANLETNIRSLQPSSSQIGVSGFFTAYSKARISMIYR
ncbi:MAG: DUF4249 domain-containing protein [Tannerellaceae bacterium]|jgi:hypothetical protein|nr:DUF4249 domain-containing protein [Tannerellaceae bacterium]